MKKPIRFVLLAFAAISVFILSCKKESSSNAPELTFVIDTGYIWTDTAMATGDTAIIGLKCNWNGYDKLSTIRTYLNEDDFMQTYNVKEAESQSLIYMTKITRSLRTKELWEFEVIDTKGHISRAGITILIDSGGPIKNVQATTGAQNYIYGSYFNIEANKNYIEAIAITKMDSIDIVGGWDIGEKTFFSSPGSAEFLEYYDLSAWSPKNLTLFCETTISEEQYELIDKDNVLISSFHADKAKDIITMLTLNKVYSFKTHLDKFGLLIIRKEAISQTDWINFDYKIQM